MICPKCGAAIKEGYCVRCGALVNVTLPTKIPTVLLVRRDTIKDIDDLEIYIGSHAVKLTQVPINFVAALLGPIWFGYRKSYVMALFLLCMNALFVITFEKTFPLPILIYIAVNFLFYFSFANAIYLFTARCKIHHLKRKYMDYFAYLQKKGGVSIVYGGILLIITLLVFIGLATQL